MPLTCFHMANILIISILLIPWIFVPACPTVEQIRTPKAMFFDITCLALIAYALYRGVKLHYRNKYLAWFVGWVFVTIIFNFYIPLSFRGVYPIWIFEHVIHTYLAITTTFICVSTFEKQDYERILKAICLSSMFVAAFSILQVFGLDPIGKMATYKAGFRNVAMLGNYTLVGNYIALTAPLFLYHLHIRKYAYGYAFISWAVLISHSEFSIVIWLIASIFTLILKFRKSRHFKKIIIISLILCSIFTCFYFKKITNLSILNRRDVIWVQAAEKIRENSLFGQGMGIFKTFDLKDDTTPLLEAHNDYIERTAELGLIGLFLMILVIINSFRRFNYKDNELGYSYMGMFVGFLLLMFGAFPMEIAPIAQLGLISFWAVERM